MVDHCFLFFKDKFPRWESECEKVEILTVEENSPVEALITAGTVAEEITKYIAKKESLDYLIRYTHFDRLKELNELDLIHWKQQGNFDKIRLLRNKAAHYSSTVVIEDTFEMHRLLFKVCTWFYKQYGNSTFSIPPYKGPIYIPPSNPNDELIKKTAESTQSNADRIKELEQKYQSLVEKLDSQTHVSESEKKVDMQVLDYELSDGVIISYDISPTNNAPSSESSLKKINGSYLLRELSKLRDSSREAVESHEGLSSFKEYLHIKRPIQNTFMERVEQIANDDSSHLIMLCGNVGDGKSHLLAYLNSKRPDLAEKFQIYNDATESFDQNEDSIETLATKVLKPFNDENLNSSNKKIILAINLGILSNFLDSEYANESYRNLRDILLGLNIFDSSNLSENHFTKNLSIINFSDYNIFELEENNDTKANSKYLSSLIDKIVAKDDGNPFYLAYCLDKESNYQSPIIYNYEMLSLENVKQAIIELIIKVSVKYKKFISARDLFDFVYRILVPPNIWEYDDSIDLSKYMNGLLPNLLFAEYYSSDFLRLLKYEDPTNFRFEKLDKMIIDLNISDDVVAVIDKYMDCSEIPFLRNSFYGFGPIRGYTSDEIRTNIINSLVRFSYIFGKEEYKSLFIEEDYHKFLDYLYYFNHEDYQKYSLLFEDVKKAVFNLQGYINDSTIIINRLNNFNIAKHLDLVSVKNKNPPHSISEGSEVLKNRFKKDILLSFKIDNSILTLNVDYFLYKYIIELNKGFKPNKNDQKTLTIFNEFIKDIINILQSNDFTVVQFLDSGKLFNLEYKDELFEHYLFKGV